MYKFKTCSNIITIIILSNSLPFSAVSIFSLPNHSTCSRALRRYLQSEEVLSCQHAETWNRFLFLKGDNFLTFKTACKTRRVHWNEILCYPCHFMETDKELTINCQFAFFTQNALLSDVDDSVNVFRENMFHRVVRHVNFW